MTVLGFDYGMRNIGVAVGQSVTGTASPLCTLPIRRGKPDWQAIEALLSTWSPDLAVVGEPVNMDGSDQSMTTAARRFARQLHGRFGLQVQHADERLTTVEARAELAAAGRLDRSDHPIAAQIIVESWFRTLDVAKPDWTS
ncbi:MAG: Holliday junction resolvase RuvX [Pseudomonadota bacterium]